MLAPLVLSYLLDPHTFLYYLFFHILFILSIPRFNNSLKYFCHLSNICFLSDSVLPSLSLYTSVVTVGRLDKLLTPSYNFLVSLFLFVSFNFCNFPFYPFLFLSSAESISFYSILLTDIQVCFFIRHFLLASFFSWIVLLHSSSHQWLAFFTSLDSLNTFPVSNNTSFRFCQS